MTLGRGSRIALRTTAALAGLAVLGAMATDGQAAKVKKKRLATITRLDTPLGRFQYGSSIPIHHALFNMKAFYFLR